MFLLVFSGPCSVRTKRRDTPPNPQPAEQGIDAHWLEVALLRQGQRVVLAETVRPLILHQTQTKLNTTMTMVKVMMMLTSGT